MTAKSTLTHGVARNNIKVRFIPEYKHRKRSYHQYQLLLTHCHNYCRETIAKHKSFQQLYNQSNHHVLLQSETYTVSKPDNNVSSIDVNEIVNTHANIVWLKLPFTGPRLCSQLSCFSVSTPGKLIICLFLCYQTV